MVTVIIVNWNGSHLLKDCLDSVRDQDFPSFEVIVVDNGSRDDSVELIKRDYPDVRLVTLSENRGFTGGNLAGYEHVRGSFIALLNNDTRPERSWLSALYQGMLHDRRIGISSSRIVIDGTDRIDSVGDVFTTAFSGTKVGYRQKCEKFVTPRFLHGGCAAAILYRKEMLDQIGFLDDDFFFNHEDTDLNLRAWLAGWQCLFVPGAIVHHKVSASVGDLSPTTVYYFSRNAEWVWVKNVPLKEMIHFLPQRVLYEISSFAFYGIKSRRLLPFLRGKVHALAKLPLMLVKRRKVQKMVRLSSEEIRAGLQPIVSYLRERIVDSPPEPKQ